MTFPFRTQRLELRLHQESDATPLQRIYARDDVARHLLEGPWTPQDAVEAVAKRIARRRLDGDPGQLAVVVEHEGRVIGDVAIWNTNEEWRQAEIGWVIDPDVGGRGFATEAAAAVLDLAFRQFGRRRVVAQMDARNDASAALCRRLGMRLEGHHVRDWWSKGEWTDTLVFAVLADEWTSGGRGASGS